MPENDSNVTVSPRACQLPGCKVVFTPKHPRYESSKFCSTEHRLAFWRMAAEVGEHVLINGHNGHQTVLLNTNGVYDGPHKSHNVRILELLKEFEGEWVDHPRRRIPEAIWNSRVAELRRRGHRIECRRVGPGNYEYRLVGSGT